VAEQLHQVNDYVERFDRELVDQMRITLASRGFHRPNRGVWRKRRRQSMPDESMNHDTPLPEEADRPEDKPRWQQAFGLAEMAELAIVGMMAGTDEALGKSLRERLRAIEADLDMEHSGRLEQLLIRRISLSWAQSHHGDVLVARAAPENLRDAKFVAGWRDRAHRRFLSAVKTLATVRKLLPPDAHGND